MTVFNFAIYLSFRVVLVSPYRLLTFDLSRRQRLSFRKCAPERKRLSANSQYRRRELRFQAAGLGPLDEMLQSREIGVAANDIGVVMMPAVNRVKLLRPGSLFEDLSALRKGNDFIPVSVKNQERDFDFFDFLEDVIADKR